MKIHKKFFIGLLTLFFSIGFLPSMAKATESFSFQPTNLYADTIITDASCSIGENRVIRLYYADGTLDISDVWNANFCDVWMPQLVGKKVADVVAAYPDEITLGAMTGIIIDESSDCENEALNYTDCLASTSSNPVDLGVVFTPFAGNTPIGNNGQITTLTTNSIFATFLSDVGQVLLQNLPLILGILAALVGLGILILYFSKFIGGHNKKIKNYKMPEYFNWKESYNRLGGKQIK